MSTDLLSHLYKGKCHSQVSQIKRIVKNIVMSIYKIGIKYKILIRKVIKNGVLFMSG
jgi:hypothetical protein